MDMFWVLGLFISVAAIVAITVFGLVQAHKKGDGRTIAVGKVTLVCLIVAVLWVVMNTPSRQDDILGFLALLGLAFLVGYVVIDAIKDVFKRE